MKTVKSIARFEGRSKLFWIVVGALLVLLVAYFDYLTGYEVSFSLFYLAPISLLTWFLGRGPGIVASLISAFAWLVVDIASGRVYSQPAIYYWNTGIRLGFYLIVAMLLSLLRRSLEHEHELARFDYLTGAANAHHFLELAQEEIERYNRYGHPFTIAYIDLDNFKLVNDNFGHRAGDEALRMVADNLKQRLRRTDFIGRLGGDEFAVLMPETGQEQAGVVISKIRQGLSEQMRANNLPVTLSVGVVTCAGGIDSAEELIAIADDLMYSVKKESKDEVKYAIYTG